MAIWFICERIQMWETWTLKPNKTGLRAKNNTQ